MCLQSNNWTKDKLIMGAAELHSSTHIACYADGTTCGQQIYLGFIASSLNSTTQFFGVSTVKNLYGQRKGGLIETSLSLIVEKWFHLATSWPTATGSNAYQQHISYLCIYTRTAPPSFVRRIVQELTLVQRLEVEIYKGRDETVSMGQTYWGKHTS